MIFVSSGSGGNGKTLFAAKPDGNAVKEVYHLDKSIPNVPTPIVAGDLLFLWHDRGLVSCFDVATGKLNYRERVGGDYHSSPIRIGNRIFCARETATSLSWPPIVSSKFLLATRWASLATLRRPSPTADFISAPKRRWYVSALLQRLRTIS